MKNTPLSPNDVITVSLPVETADALVGVYNALYGTFGWNIGTAPLHTLKASIEQGKIVLIQEKEKEAAATAKKEKPPYETVICSVPATTKNHDCWILHKSSKRLFYAPYAHHYQLIEYLMNNHSDVIDSSWHKSDTASPEIRTGDVKQGLPRTAKENAVTHKGLRKALVKAYYETRNMVAPASVLI